jgi:hypothetical protein
VHMLLLLVPIWGVPARVVLCLNACPFLLLVDTTSPSSADALLVFVHVTWSVTWLSYLPCRIWRNIIIIKSSQVHH